MHIDQIIDSIYRLPDASKEMLKEHMEFVCYAKGHLLFKAGRIEHNLYFIRKGIARAYANAVAHEITFWFGKEGDTVLSMKSYIDNHSSYENIALLEDCELYQLKTQSLQALFIKDIHIANWGRKLAERELIKTEERLISRQVRSASDRYKELLRDHPNLLQRVPLAYIASYLGITQVSLSRIRASL
jgi:CRP-like cAMP-binding protein